MTKTLDPIDFGFEQQHLAKNVGDAGHENAEDDAIDPGIAHEGGHQRTPSATASAATNTRNTTIRTRKRRERFMKKDPIGWSSRSPYRCRRNRARQAG